MDDLFLRNPGLAIGLCVASYIADCYVTLYSVRLYLAYGWKHFSYSGSPDLRPYFQDDIDQVPKVSPRFLPALLAMVAVGVLFWGLTAQLGFPQLFVFLIGALLLRQAPTLLHHLQNIFLFRSLRDSQTVTGRVEYSRPMLYRLSAVDMAGFAMLFLLLTPFACFFFLGGATGCAIIGLKHWHRQAIHKGATQPPALPKET